MIRTLRFQIGDDTRGTVKGLCVKYLFLIPTCIPDLCTKKNGVQVLLAWNIDKLLSFLGGIVDVQLAKEICLHLFI